MAYHEGLKNPLFANPFKCIVRIPQLIEIDPEGMAKKYNLSVKDLDGKTDFDLIVDQKIYQERLYRGKPPVIDIEGDRFFVDMRWDELRWVKDISKRIVLRDHRDESTGKYCFYYNQATKQVETISSTITRLPAGVVKVELPEDEVLDPYEAARVISFERKNIGENEIKDFLMKVPFQKDLKATIIPHFEVERAEKIKVNEGKQSISKEPLLKKKRETNNKRKHII
jgi:hypothetical protein